KLPADRLFFPVPPRRTPSKAASPPSQSHTSTFSRLPPDFTKTESKKDEQRHKKRPHTPGIKICRRFPLPLDKCSQKHGGRSQNPMPYSGIFADQMLTVKKYRPDRIKQRKQQKNHPQRIETIQKIPRNICRCHQRSEERRVGKEGR